MQGGGDRGFEGIPGAYSIINSGADGSRQIRIPEAERARMEAERARMEAQQLAENPEAATAQNGAAIPGTNEVHDGIIAELGLYMGDRDHPIEREGRLAEGSSFVPDPGLAVDSGIEDPNNLTKPPVTSAARRRNGTAAVVQRPGAYRFTSGKRTDELTPEDRIAVDEFFLGIMRELNPDGAEIAIPGKVPEVAAPIGIAGGIDDVKKTAVEDIIGVASAFEARAANASTFQASAPSNAIADFLAEDIKLLEATPHVVRDNSEPIDNVLMPLFGSYYGEVRFPNILDKPAFARLDQHHGVMLSRDGLKLRVALAGIEYGSLSDSKELNSQILQRLTQFISEQMIAKNDNESFAEEMPNAIASTLNHLQNDLLSARPTDPEIQVVNDSTREDIFNQVAEGNSGFDVGALEIDLESGHISCFLTRDLVGVYIDKDGNCFYLKDQPPASLNGGRVFLMSRDLYNAVDRLSGGKTEKLNGKTLQRHPNAQLFIFPVPENKQTSKI